MVEDFKGLLSKEAEDSSDEPSSDESGSDQEVDVPREEVTQLGTLMVDKSDEPANREGTHVRCSAKSCMHNMEGHCAKEEIKLRFNGQTVECENFQPTSPTKGVKDPPPSYDDE